jgi:hypothetical protein
MHEISTRGDAIQVDPADTIASHDRYDASAAVATIRRHA